MKKNIFLTTAVGIIAFAMVFITACTSSKQSDSVKESDVQSAKAEDSIYDESSGHPFSLSNSYYQKLMDSSLVSTGNNFRLKKAIEKLKSGQKTYVACIGGSVTEGAGPKVYTQGYAYQFKQMLAEQYSPDGGSNIVFTGAGLGGTSSLLGLLRYEQDVLEPLGHTPDILVIEFAVNDGGPAVNTRSFEALVRNALLADSETAVIALYAAATYPNTQGTMTQTSTYYRIPEVSISDAITEQINAGIVQKNHYYSDNVHPKKEGHTFMADCLMNLFAKVDSMELKESVPVPEETLRSKSLANLIRIYDDDENVKIQKGSFNKVDQNCQSYLKTGKSNFTTNWHKSYGTENESFIMNVNCRALLLVYKEQGSWLTEKFGKADVYVDGVKKMSLDGGKNGGWNNCVMQMIIDAAETEEHIVEIKMQDDFPKQGFTIVGLGYVK